MPMTRETFLSCFQQALLAWSGLSGPARRVESPLVGVLRSLPYPPLRWNCAGVLLDPVGLIWLARNGGRPQRYWFLHALTYARALELSERDAIELLQAAEGCPEPVTEGVLEWRYELDRVIEVVAELHRPRGAEGGLDELEGGIHL